MLPNEYKTGNKKMDTAIEAQLARESRPFFPNLPRPNKYHVSDIGDRTWKNGTVFSSKKEMKRWDDLLLAERAKQIKNLRRQVTFVLQEEFISRQYGEIKPIIYIADFTYTNISFLKDYSGAREVVEDSKGFRTTEYRIKRKMFLYRYGAYLFYEV